MKLDLGPGDVEGCSSSLSGSDQKVRSNHSLWYREPEAEEDDLEKDEACDNVLEEDVEITTEDVFDSADSVSESVIYSSDWTGPSL